METCSKEKKMKKKYLGGTVQKKKIQSGTILLLSLFPTPFFLFVSDKEKPTRC